MANLSSTDMLLALSKLAQGMQTVRHLESNSCPTDVTLSPIDPHPGAFAANSTRMLTMKLRTNNNIITRVHEFGHCLVPWSSKQRLLRIDYISCILL